MKLSIIIPVYNERNTILQVIERVAALPLDKEIIVVDDGSTDGTRDLLAGLDVSRLTSHVSRFKAILQDRNCGKGAAVRRGIREAAGDYIVFQDADLELDPGNIPALLSKAEEGHPAVYGSRFLKPVKIAWVSLMANRLLTALTNVLFGGRITDMETCYKLCARQALLSLDLRADRFDIEPEITCKLLRRGYAIVELPVFYVPRKEGKKIGWKDGFHAIGALFRYRFQP